MEVSGPVWLLALVCCCEARSYYLLHETQNKSNTDEVLRMLDAMARILSRLSEIPLTTIVVEMEIVFAKVNLEYLLENLDPAVERAKVEPQIADMKQRLNGALSDLPVQYVTPDVAKSMRIFSSYQKRLKGMLAPLSIGRINYRHALSIEDFVYRKLILEQENLYNKTDRCLQKLLHHGNEVASSSQKCTVDVACYDYFTKREKYGIFLVQAGLYITVAKYFGCEPEQADEDLVRLCEYMYAEMLTVERYGFPGHFTEVFGLQMSFCGTVGFGEFVKPRWLRKLLSYEESPGAYRNPLSADRDEGVLSAELLGCLALHARAALETDLYSGHSADVNNTLV